MQTFENDFLKFNKFFDFLKLYGKIFEEKKN